MGPKSPKPTGDKKAYSDSSGITGSLSDDYDDITRGVAIRMILKGETPPPYADKKGPIVWSLLLLFDGEILCVKKWQHDTMIKYNLELDLSNSRNQAKVVDKPLLLLLRSSGGKLGKDPDPLAHPDNRAGGTVDLMPLVIGAEEIDCKVRLLSAEGIDFGCKVKFYAIPMPSIVLGLSNKLVPLLITMISAHCLPASKEGTVYVAALGLDGLIDPVAANFGMSLSRHNATKLLFADASTGGEMMNSAYHTPDDEMFQPFDVETTSSPDCISVYWNTIKRFLVNPKDLLKRLATSFVIEVAGMPRLAKGKIEVRGRYMGLVDARVLLYPGQTTVITCANLKFFNEAELPEGIGPLLNLPSTSQKSSARSPAGPVPCIDAEGHKPYIVIRFDLYDPVVLRMSTSSFFNKIGFIEPQGELTFKQLELDSPLNDSDSAIDVTNIRKECGAIAVHKELSCLASKGAVPMNQGIKKTAANKLLTRVKTMLKQFSPGDCSYIEWQDTVTAHHAAARRAVTASFRPQIPYKPPGDIHSASRARMAGDVIVASKHIEHNLKAENHPRTCFSKALRALEARNDKEAILFTRKAIDLQLQNRSICMFLLWAYGGMIFDKSEDNFEIAKNVFRIATTGDSNCGVPCTVAWSALHALHHHEGDQYGAFVAARGMRKAFELGSTWTDFYQLWIDTSGEEETLWVPSQISAENPFLIAATTFLFLRCYKFSELLLQCLEKECASKGSRLNYRTKITVDIYYLRAVSWLLRRQVTWAREYVDKATRRFGPTPMMSEMRATCLLATGIWDKEREEALCEAERAGSLVCSALLLECALRGFKIDLEASLQRAARAHKANPCGYTALALARIYYKQGDSVKAEKWAAGAVKLEPWLTDAWAFLAILAMDERNVEKARTMLRTANQLGSMSPEISKQVKKLMKSVKIETFSDIMVKNLCFCQNIEPTASQTVDRYL